MPAPVATDPVLAARALAEDLLWPAAAEIERTDAVPPPYLDALAAAGLYGLFGPAELGGADAGPRTAGRVVEALAGASLTTTLVWIQHHSVVRALRAAPPALRDPWLPDLVAGRTRAGIAYAALRRPGPPAMTAVADGSGWRLTGSAPWVSGWGRIDVLYVGAVVGDDIVWVLVDPAPSATLSTRALRLSAVGASSTVALSLRDHPVDAAAVVAREPLADWRRRDRAGLRGNGHLALGVAGRAAGLLGDPALADEVDRIRRHLDEGPEGDVVRTRAAATLLAQRAATALVVAGGGRSTDWDADAARLARDAGFLLVFGQTAEIRRAQLAALTP